MECPRPRSSQNSSKIVPFPFLLAIAFLIVAPCQIRAAGGFRLCGLKLTMTLNAVCKNQLCGGYAMGLHMNKRSPSPLDLTNGQQTAIGNENDPLAIEFDEQQRILDRPKRSYPYGAFGMVKKSGIATECCSKRCTLGYLKTYCCATPVFKDDSDDEGEEVKDEGNEP